MKEYEEVGNSELQELSLLLESRTFVDYFNVFLSLPVFGQHIFYNYVEAEFDFEPPIRHRRHLFLDRREILQWLYTRRLRAFKLSPLYSEYKLCNQLRQVDAPLPGLKDSDEDGVDRKTFTRNLMGTATGMLLFRESMRGTCGECVYRCWKDIETWRQIEDTVRRMYWKNAIRTKYISQASTSQVPGRIKFLVYQGMLNFDLIPDAAVQQTIIDGLCKDGSVQAMESDEAMIQLQKILFTAMTSYWVPRHLLHVIKSVSEETLAVLTRPAPGDTEYLSQERKNRCRFMFPTIYEHSDVTSPATAVFTSNSAGELPRSPSADLVDDDYDDDDDHVEIDPLDLFQLWTGPSKEIAVEKSPLSSCSYTPSFDDESPDEISRRQLKSANFSRVVRSPVPIILTSYLGGKKRTLLGRFPKTTNRIIWSLASDMLACFPFRAFLEKKEHISDLHYLSFWNDVRTYLDTDESAVDCFGHPLRRILAHRLMQKYLSSNGESCEIFSETLKMALFNAISNNNDVALLSMAQDIVQESLWEPLKLYIEDERRGFLQQVRGRRFDLDQKRRRQQNMLANQARTGHACSEDHCDPMYGFSCAMIDSDSATTGSPAVFSPTIPCASDMSRPATSYHISLSEEQMWKAMEHTVLCCEYGTSMMLPQTVPSPQDLIDILHSDYGSLHVKRIATVRNEALNKLMFRPKINIETIRVSRKVIEDKVDLDAIRRSNEEEGREDTALRQRNRLVIRRNGMVLDRPNRPKSFIEVLTTPTHYEFFKRFMLVQKAGLPVYFWKAIEDLKEISNAKTRQIRVTQIMRKFFGKYAKYGASLDCHEEIIRQIPNMEKVTPGILICAQAAIFRSMERKWYLLYMDSYPQESDTSEASASNVIHVTLQTETSPEMTEIVLRSKKPKKRYGCHKVIIQWKNLIKALCSFCQAISSRSECQLLEIFLKCEVEKEVSSGPKEHTHNQATERNIALSAMATNVQTRVVIRNRLVIMNRLPQDLKYWMEVKKYQDLVDSATQRGAINDLDNEILVDKARSVISCFLHSDVLPRVQVNIPNDMALTIINNLAMYGPTRGLFHDSVILIFPLLYHFWKKFTDEWMNGDIPDDYIDTIERVFRARVSDTPHGGDYVPGYMNLTDKDFKVVTQSMFDETMFKIHFSISEGVSFIYPMPRVTAKSPGAAGGRRMTKHSIHALAEETSPRRGESRVGQHGTNADARRNRHSAEDANGKKKPGSAGKEKESKRKQEKIQVKELERKKSTPDNGEAVVAPKPSMDKAKRLSKLVEALNQEREEKFREQNRKFSNKMTFEQVVAAAMNDLSDSGSVFS